MPVTSRSKPFYTAFAVVQSVKFCTRTAHSTVTEKYDGVAALTA